MENYEVKEEYTHDCPNEDAEDPLKIVDMNTYEKYLDGENIKQEIKEENKDDNSFHILRERCLTEKAKCATDKLLHSSPTKIDTLDNVEPPLTIVKYEEDTVPQNQSSFTEDYNFSVKEEQYDVDIFDKFSGCEEKCFSSLDDIKQENFTKEEDTQSINESTENREIASPTIKEPSEESKLIRQTIRTSKVYECKLCGKSFRTPSVLRDHMNIHTGEKPFECYVCERRFTDRRLRTAHLQTHTKEKPHQCTVCKKSFSRSTMLAEHLRRHNGERPFECNDCGKRFFSSANLIVHRRTHTGERPYSCTQCDKCFYTNNLLVNHLRSHNGERPFECNMCEKKYSRNAHLMKHLRTHDREKQLENLKSTS